MLLGLSFELGNKKLPELHQSVFVEGPKPLIPRLPLLQWDYPQPYLRQPIVGPD